MALWWAYFPADHTEVELLWNAAGERLPPARYAITYGEEFQEEGPTQFALGVDAGSLSGAISAAGGEWERLRGAAGLPRATGRLNRVDFVIGPVDEAAPLHDTLLARARQLLRTGEHSYAVVVAVAAFEVYVRELVRDAAAREMPHELADSVQALFRRAPRGRPQEKFLEGLIGRKLEESGDLWIEYKSSLRSRHAIVHDGAIVDEDQSVSSIRAIGELIEWFERQLASRP